MAIKAGLSTLMGTELTSTASDLPRYESHSNGTMDDKISVLPSLEQMFTPKTVKAALKGMRKGRTPGIDRTGVRQLRKILQDHNELEKLISLIVRGNYRPQVLQECEIPKEGKPGEVRTILIPTVRDALIQRVILNFLNQVLEPIFAPVSFGYRIGKGLDDALQTVSINLQSDSEIQVLETDVQNFFNEVNRDRLLAKLSKFVQDPNTLELINRMISAKRVDQNGKLTETPLKGIPQGIPLAPTLANLYLNDLDHILIKAGIKVVRWADDLVLFFNQKRRDEVMQVLQDNVQAIGLNLKDSKTRLCNPSSGETFVFLGFEFFADGTVAYVEPRLKAQRRRLDQLKRDTVTTGEHLSSQRLTAYMRDLAKVHGRHFNFSKAHLNEFEAARVLEGFNALTRYACAQKLTFKKTR